MPPLLGKKCRSPQPPQKGKAKAPFHPKWGAKGSLIARLSFPAAGGGGGGDCQNKVLKPPLARARVDQRSATYFFFPRSVRPKVVANVG